eukprot:2080428-Rhodomonas_salina.3
MCRRAGGDPWVLAAPGVHARGLTDTDRHCLAHHDRRGTVATTAVTTARAATGLRYRPTRAIPHVRYSLHTTTARGTTGVRRAVRRARSNVQRLHVDLPRQKLPFAAGRDHGRV